MDVERRMSGRDSSAGYLAVELSSGGDEDDPLKERSSISGEKPVAVPCQSKAVIFLG